jgi:hypothetical protein
VLVLSTIPLALVGAHTSMVLISLVLVVRGLSIGFSFMPAMTAAFAAMRPDQLSDATPQLNVVMRLGGTIGTAVLAVVLQRAGANARVHDPVKLAHAFDTAYWWALGIAVMSLVPSFMLLHAERPQATAAAARAAAEGGEIAQPVESLGA